MYKTVFYSNLLRNIIGSALKNIQNIEYFPVACIIFAHYRLLCSRLKDVVLLRQMSSSNEYRKSTSKVSA